MYAPSNAASNSLASLYLTEISIVWKLAKQVPVPGMVPYNLQNDGEMAYEYRYQVFYKGK
jgi:hypothetical protein